MCPTKRMMEERSCTGGCVITPQNFPKLFLTAVAIVIVLGNLVWIAHAIERILFAVGCLVVGTVAGYVWVRRVVPARRAQAQALAATWHQQAAMAGQRQQFPAQQHALPQGHEVHQHVHFHGADAVQQYQEQQQ